MISKLSFNGNRLKICFALILCILYSLECSKIIRSTPTLWSSLNSRKTLLRFYRIAIFVQPLNIYQKSLLLRMFFWDRWSFYTLPHPNLWSTFNQLQLVHLLWGAKCIKFHTDTALKWFRFLILFSSFSSQLATDSVPVCVFSALPQKWLKKNKTMNLNNYTERNHGGSQLWKGRVTYFYFTYTSIIWYRQWISSLNIYFLIQ